MSEKIDGGCTLIVDENICIMAEERTALDDDEIEDELFHMLSDAWEETHRKD